MIDFLDWIGRVLESGITWSTLVAAFVVFGNYQEKRHLRRITYLIAEKVGVKWDTPQEELRKMVQRNYKRFYLLSHKESILRRMTMDKLKSRKLWLALFGAIIPVLNVELGINLDPNVIFAMLASIIAGIAALAHVDGKKAQAVVATLKASVPVDPNATYKDMFPTIKAVHDGINKLLEGAKIDDKDALAAYKPILDIIKSFEHPQPVAEIPEQVSA